MTGVQTCALPICSSFVGQELGEKVIVFKFRRRKNYRRKRGHRQPFTALEITKIVA